MALKIFARVALGITCCIVLASGAAMADSAQSAPGYGYYQPPSYNYGYQSEPYGYSGQGGVALCAQRFRSFNPATGTYRGYDGRERACPYLGAPSAAEAGTFQYAPPSNYGYGYSQPYPYGAPIGYGRPPGVQPRDRVTSPPRGNPDRTYDNATTEPF